MIRLGLVSFLRLYYPTEIYMISFAPLKLKVWSTSFELCFWFGVQIYRLYVKQKWKMGLHNISEPRA